MQTKIFLPKFHSKKHFHQMEITVVLIWMFEEYHQRKVQYEKKKTPCENELDGEMELLHRILGNPHLDPPKKNHT